MNASVSAPVGAPARLRPARSADAAAIAALYGHHVRTGRASFELTAPDAAELARRIAAVQEAGLPYLVAELETPEGAVLAGFAYAGPYRPRPAYRFTVEDSVYVDPACQGRGIGRSLLSAVIDAATAAGRRQMIAVIGDSANHGSIGLHRALGFAQVGCLTGVGWKHETWLDTVFMQRALGIGADSPPAD
jgi:phosphinothricin acetyltransferase